MNSARWAALMVLVPSCFTTGCGRAGNGTPPSAANGGILEVLGGPVFDIGTIDEAAGVTYSVRLRNISGKRVVLKKNVPTSCGCTDAVLDRTTLAPLEETTLTVGIGTDGKPPGTVQRVSATVHVATPTGTEPVVCYFIIQLKARWRIIPDVLNFVCAPGAERQFKFDLLGRDDEEVVFEEIKSDLPGFRSEYQPGPLAARTPTPAKISFRAPATPGEHHYKVIFKTNDPKVPERTLPVRVQTLAPWRAVPETIVLQSDSDGGSVRKHLTLVGPSRPKSVRLDVSGIKGVKAELMPAPKDDNGRYQQGVELVLDAPAPAGTMERGVLKIQVIEPEHQTDVRVSLIRVGSRVNAATE